MSESLFRVFFSINILRLDFSFGSLTKDAKLRNNRFSNSLSMAESAK